MFGTLSCALAMLRTLLARGLLSEPSATPSDLVTGAESGTPRVDEEDLRGGDEDLRGDGEDLPPHLHPVPPSPATRALMTYWKAGGCVRHFWCKSRMGDNCNSLIVVFDIFWCPNSV